jgi:hypothetical protein
VIRRRPGLRSSQAAARSREDWGGEDQPLGACLRLLWERSGNRVITSGVPLTGRPSRKYAIVPGVGRPRLLIPLDHRKVVSTSLRRNGNGIRWEERLVGGLASLAAVIGLLQLGLRNHVQIARDPATEGQPSALPIEEHLKRQLGRDDLELAVILGQDRMNWKPTIQVLTERGQVVAYVKVGWDRLSRRLIRNEAVVLRRLTQHRLSHVRVPRVLHTGSWNGLDLLLVSPARQRIPWLSRRDTTLPFDATREIAWLESVDHVPLEDSSFWHLIRKRAEAVHAPDALGAKLQLSLSTIGEIFGTRRMVFGFWHGDWHPWNMVWVGRSLFTWDWERSRGGVPVGFDVIHFLMQTSPNRGIGLSNAIEDSYERSLPVIEELLGTSRDTGVLCGLYLVELLLRYAESAADRPRKPQGSWELVDVLYDWTQSMTNMRSIS